VQVIELGEVLPDNLLTVVLARGVGDLAIGPMGEPIRVFLRKAGINGAMVDHKVNHDFQSGGMGLLGHLPDLVFRRRLALRVQQLGIESEVVGDRIEAARGA
jgi:hypothetical protein